MEFWVVLPDTTSFYLMHNDGHPLDDLLVHLKDMLFV